MRLRHWLNTRGRIIAGLLALIGIIALLIGLLWATNALGWRKWRVVEIQQFIGTQLPDGANDVQFATQAEKTRILWLRFILPAQADLADFLQQMGIDKKLIQSFTPFPAPNPAEAAIAWWTPQAAQTYSGLHAIQAGKVYELLLDQSDTANPIVYLRVYTIGMNDT